MLYSKLSLRSILYNRRQYTSLFAVCFIGFCIMFSVISITDGMLKAVRQKARQYYGGDIQFLGGTTLGTTEADEQQKELEKLVPEHVQFFQRFDYDAHQCMFFYEGASVRQRVAKGIDFDAEKDLLSSYTLAEGSIKSNKEHNSILISLPVAQKLGVHAGDLITVQMNTIYGTTNTMSMQVSGIFLDSSLFGMYTSYMDIRALRTITSYPSNYVNRLCLFYGSTPPSDKEINELQAKAEKVFHMYPLCSDKDEFYNALLYDKNVEKPIFALIPLDSNVEELQNFIDALRFIVLIIVAILIIIIAVGIGSTYRVIVIKRTTEIGIYRALGMKPSGIRNLFLTESSFIVFLGFISGIIFAFLITFILSKFNFSFIPAFDIFLSKGHLMPYYNAIKTILILCIVTVTTLFSVLFTIRKLVRLSPVGALATTN